MSCCNVSRSNVISLLSDRCVVRIFLIFIGSGLRCVVSRSRFIAVDSFFSGVRWLFECVVWNLLACALIDFLK